MHLNIKNYLLVKETLGVCLLIIHSVKQASQVLSPGIFFSNPSIYI